MPCVLHEVLSSLLMRSAGHLVQHLGTPPHRAGRLFPLLLDTLIINECSISGCGWILCFILNFFSFLQYILQGFTCIIML